MSSSCCYLFSFQILVHLVGSIFLLLYIFQIGLKPVCRKNYAEQLLKWLILYLGVYFGYLLIGYNYFTPLIAKAGFWYLIVLSSVCFIKFIRILTTHNFKLRPIKCELYVVLILVGFLSIIQTQQSIGLLLTTPDLQIWLIPMFCKHTSLILYLSILYFISWEIRYIDEHCIHINKDHCMPTVSLWLLILCFIIPITQIFISLIRLGIFINSKTFDKLAITEYIDFFWSPMFSIFLLWLIVRYMIRYAHCITTSKSRFSFDKSISYYPIFISFIIGFVSGTFLRYVEVMLNWHDAYIGFIITIFAMTGFMFEQLRQKENREKFNLISYSYIWLWGNFSYYFLLYIGK